MFTQRLAGHSVARITRALNDAGIPCPRRPTRSGTRTAPARRGRWARSRPSWPTRGTPAARCGTGSAPNPNSSTRRTPAWGTGRCSAGTCPPDGSSPPGPPTRPLVSEADYIAARDASALRGPAGAAARRYLLAGLLVCGRCGRRLESTWSNGKPAYRCPHGYSSATRPGSPRRRTLYVREDQILARLAVLAILQASDSSAVCTKRAATQITEPARTAELIDSLRCDGITLIYDPATRVLRTNTDNAVAVTVTR
jgi:hypothetical protein